MGVFHEAKYKHLLSLKLMPILANDIVELILRALVAAEYENGIALIGEHSSQDNVYGLTHAARSNLGQKNPSQTLCVKYVCVDIAKSDFAQSWVRTFFGDEVIDGCTVHSVICYKCIGFFFGKCWVVEFLGQGLHV